MPIYEYRCDSCGRVFEVIQKFSDEPLSLDPECGKGPVERLISAPAFQFKGTGFYITDYAKGKDGGANVPPSKSNSESKSSNDSKSNSDSKSSSDSTASSSDSKTSESKSTESKSSETKSSDSSASTTKSESKPAAKD